MVAINNCMNKINKQCRLCGQFAKKLKHLFKGTIKVCEDTEQFSLKPIPDVIKECLNFSITESEVDNLPKTVCVECTKKLSSWQKFQKLCAKQQNIFNCLNTDSVNNNGYETPTSHCNNVEISNRNRSHKDVTQRTLSDEEIAVTTNKDVKYRNVKSQNQRRNKTKSVNENDIIREEANKECNKIQRIQKEGQKKTKLIDKIDPDSNVNTKQSKVRASRCMYCKTIFKTKEEQIYHRGSETRCVFLCHKCPKEFQLKFSLRKHLETHEKQRKYCCHVCGNLFMTMACLKSHIQLHDKGSKKFKCSECPKQFHQSAQLNQHFNVHTGEKRYACSECPKRFNHRFQLDRHIEGVHKKVKKYKCLTCDKSFLYTNNFKAHLMRHSGQKDVECDICKKCFVTKNALFRHQRFHTGEKPFPCPECGKLFADCSNRKRHVIQYHGINCADNIGKCLEERKSLNIMDDNTQHQENKPKTLRSYFESQEILLSDRKSEESFDGMSDDENDNNRSSNNNVNNDNHYISNHLQTDTFAVTSDENSNKSNINSILKNLENGELTVTVLNEQNIECLQLVATENLLHFENLLINNSTTDCSNELTNVKNKLLFDTELNTCEQSDDVVGKTGDVFDTNYTAMFSLSDSETVCVNSIKDLSTLVPSGFGLTSDSFVSDDDLIETNLVEEQQMLALDEVDKIVPLDALSVIKMLNTNDTVLFAVPDNEDYLALPEIAVDN